MSDGEFLVIAALLRKLGGEVTITDKELQEARDMEVLQCVSDDFFMDVRYKVRPKPVTIEGETVADDPLPQANLVPHIKHIEAIVTEHFREVIAVHEGHGEEAWCPACREHWPCRAVKVLE